MEKGDHLDWQKLIDVSLTAPGNIGSSYSRFPRYSFLNNVWLWSQGVHEPYGRYDVWQTIGRHVLRGAKAKSIIRPITINRKNDEDEIEATFTRFRGVSCIFALSDTGGDDPPPVVTPQWDLDMALDRLEIKRVPFAALDGNMAGYSMNREYAVNPVAPNPLKTTYHEIGHILLGHTAQEQLPDYQQHKGVKEFQAEATAMLTMKELDVLSDEQASVSRAYCQTWLRDERPSDVAIRQVFGTTEKILKAGRLAVEGGDNAC